MFTPLYKLSGLLTQLEINYKSSEWEMIKKINLNSSIVIKWIYRQLYNELYGKREVIQNGEFQKRSYTCTKLVVEKFIIIIIALDSDSKVNHARSIIIICWRKSTVWILRPLQVIYIRLPVIRKLSSHVGSLWGALRLVPYMPVADSYQIVVVALRAMSPWDPSLFEPTKSIISLTRLVQVQTS